MKFNMVYLTIKEFDIFPISIDKQNIKDESDFNMNKEFIVKNITKELSLKNVAVNNTIELFEGGATIPFIARYRKEKTGGLDEIEIRSVSERLDYYKELEKRKETILNTIESQGKLTPELKEKILVCTDKTILEDIYLPYKPKKTTRATVAKNKGLGPLADLIYLQATIKGTKEEIVAPFINPEKGVNNYEEAINGAMDIIAEKISDDEFIRGWVRNNIQNKGLINSTVKKDW